MKVGVKSSKHSRIWTYWTKHNHSSDRLCPWDKDNEKDELKKWDLTFSVFLWDCKEEVKPS